MQGFAGPIANVGSNQKEKKDMRIEEEQLTESLMREYIRKKFVLTLMKVLEEKKSKSTNYV